MFASHTFREYQIFPYNLAEITLMPAEHLSETGKRRNMHMQTHRDLDGVDAVRVFGIGQRKGQLALLQLVKDAYDFKTDLLLDEQEEATRNARPFITPHELNPTEQLINLPANPNRIIRDLFETESQQATTPSEVGYNAHQAAMQYLQGNLQTGTTSARPRINANTPTLQEGDVFASTNGENAKDNRNFHPSTLVSHFRPESVHSRNQDDAQSSQYPVTQELTMNPHIVPAQQPITNRSSTLEEVVDAGMSAARRIYHGSPTIDANGQFIVPRLPPVKDFLDVERCREVLQEVDMQAHHMFEAWQNNQKFTCQPSWANRADTYPSQQTDVQSNVTHTSQPSWVTRATAYQAVEQPTAEHNGMDDSGIGSMQDSTKQVNEPLQPMNKNRFASGEKIQGDMESAIQPIPSENNLHNPIRHPSQLPKTKEVHDEQEDAPTPTMSAASTLLSLSPIKSVEASNPTPNKTNVTENWATKNAMEDENSSSKTMIQAGQSKAD